MRFETTARRSAHGLSFPGRTELVGYDGAIVIEKVRKQCDNDADTMAHEMCIPTQQILFPSHLHILSPRAVTAARAGDDVGLSGATFADIVSKRGGGLIRATSFGVLVRGH